MADVDLYLPAPKEYVERLEGSIVEEAENFVHALFVLAETDEMMEKYGETLMRAESKREGNKDHCYCRACLVRDSEAANDAIWEILNISNNEREAERLYDLYSYSVYWDGRSSRIINGEDRAYLESKPKQGPGDGYAGYLNWMTGGST